MASTTNPSVEERQPERQNWLEASYDDSGFDATIHTRLDFPETGSEKDASLPHGELRKRIEKADLTTSAHAGSGLLAHRALSTLYGQDEVRGGELVAYLEVAFAGNLVGGEAGSRFYRYANAHHGFVSLAKRIVLSDLDTGLLSKKDRDSDLLFGIGKRGERQSPKEVQPAHADGPPYPAKVLWPWKAEQMPLPDVARHLSPLIERSESRIGQWAKAEDWYRDAEPANGRTKKRSPRRTC